MSEQIYRPGAIVPRINAKPVGEMVPGELIRFRFRGRMPLGIVAGCDFLQIPSGRVIVLLEDVPDRPGTTTGFTPVADAMMSETALSYGTSHTIVVHPSAPAASIDDERFATNGALLVGKGSRAIRSRSTHDYFSEVTLTVDVDNWAAIQNAYTRQRPVAVLGWELRLLPEVPLDPPLPPVFIFRAGG